MSGKDESIKTESRVVAARGWEEGEWGVTAGGSGVFLGRDEVFWN